MSARGDSAAKGPVKIEAAAASCGIQGFTHHVEPRHGTHHEAFGIELGKSHAAAGVAGD